jgi:uncharacterized protein YbaP (TraB family)
MDRHAPGIVALPARGLRLAAALLLALLVLPAGVRAAATSLWEARREGQQIFLLGALHVLRPQDYPLPPEMEAAYRACSAVVFETDLGALERPDTQMQMLALGTYPEGQSLLSHLDAGERRLLTERAAHAGLPLEQLVRLRPWLGAVMLTMAELQRMGFDPAAGVDRHFFQRAREDGKRIYFLETVEDQFRILADLPPDLQGALLKQTLADLGDLAAMAAEMTSTWRDGDGDALDRAVNRGLNRHPDLRRRLLTERNRSWGWLLSGPLAAESPLLVVVGAGHLVGSLSLPEILRQTGFQVGQH